MYIQAQGGGRILPMNIGFVTQAFATPNILIFAFPNADEDSYVIIGHYATEKDSLRVLQQICEHIRECERGRLQDYYVDPIFKMPSMTEVNELTVADIVRDIHEM